jgi:catechol 2,3-dioxygenase-like lactoylglutathione lyase family enzyme
MATVSVRYIVDDVDAAIDFYTQRLDFAEVMHPAPTFAMLSRGDLRLALSAPSGAGGGGQAMPDGTKPEPGGWNRFSLEVADLASIVEELRKAGVHFSCSTTHQAIQSSYSNRPSRKPHCRLRDDAGSVRPVTVL